MHLFQTSLMWLLFLNLIKRVREMNEFEVHQFYPSRKPLNDCLMWKWNRWMVMMRNECVFLCPCVVFNNRSMCWSFCTSTEEGTSFVSFRRGSVNVLHLLQLTCITLLNNIEKVSGKYNTLSIKLYWRCQHKH